MPRLHLLSASALKRLMFSGLTASASPARGEGFEAPHFLGHRHLGGWALPDRSAEDPDDALGAAQHIGGVLRFGERAAVAEDDHVRVPRNCGVTHRLDLL